ncbi:hypothetical protein KXW36_000744, partial [Aspergillus fumigatus]
ECDEALQPFGLGRRPSDAGPVPDDHARRCGLLLLSEARAGRRSVLHRQGRQRLGDLAGRDRAGNADPGRRSDREEAPGTALFREGADLFEARLRRAAGDVPRFHAAEGRALSLLSPAQEAGRRAGPAAIRHPRPGRQRRVLRRRFHPLHDDRRRRRLRPAQEGFRGLPPASAQGARRHQGR